MAEKHCWTIYVITDTGMEVPHWSEDTRALARDSLKRYREAYPNAKFKLKRTR